MTVLFSNLAIKAYMHILQTYYGVLLDLQHYMAIYMIC